MRQISTVIEIGTSKVVCIISEGGQTDEAHILGSASFPYAGYKNRKWADRHSLAPALMKAIHEAERIAGKRSRQIHIGIPADFVKVFCRKAEVSFPKYKTLTQGDVAGLYKASMNKLDVPKEYTVIHRCPVNFIIDDARKTMDPVGQKAIRISALISYVIAERWFVAGVTKILENNGYSASTLISASYAEAMNYIPQSVRDRGAIMVDIGNTSTCVMFVHGDGVVFHKILPFGGINITNDLAKIFSVKHELADELKKRSIYGLSLSDDDMYEVCDRETYKFERFPAKDVQAVIEARLTEMLELICTSLDKSGCLIPQYAPVFVTGGTASMRGIREFIQKITGHNTVIVQPQSTCFNQPAYSSALAVTELALEAETEDEPGFFANLKNNIFG